MVDVAASSFHVVFDTRTSMVFALKLSRVHVEVAGNDVRFTGVGVPLITRAKGVWISTRYECALFELEPSARTSSRRRCPYIFVGGSAHPLYPFTTPNPITEMSYPPAAVPRAVRFALCTDGAHVYRMEHGATHTVLPLPPHSRMEGMSLSTLHTIITLHGKQVHAPRETSFRLRRNVRVVVA
jgi:hypothetical protein